MVALRSITSRQNPVVARLRALAEEPDPSGARVLLDGVHLVRDARNAAASFELVAVAASRLASDTEEGRLARTLSSAGVEVIEAPDGVFAAISPVRTPSGIVAVASRRVTTAADICAPADAFVLVAADVQDPGNVGALARIAEAGGATGMLVCGASANPFAWKAVRGSMGSALRLPMAGGLATSAALECLKKAGVRSIAAVPRGGADPDAVAWRGKIAIVLGGEGAGLPDEVIDACDERVSIPMAAHVESLNVAAAGAILVYAARRTRA